MKRTLSPVFLSASGIILTMVFSQGLGAQEGAPTLTLRGHPDSVYRVLFSPDGTYLAALSNGALFLWDAKTGKRKRAIRGHGTWIADAAFSPDGKQIATVAHWEETAKLWETATGRDIQNLTWRYLNPKVKGTRVGNVTIETRTPGWQYRSMERVVFSPDGKQLATPGSPLVTVAGMGEDDHGEVRLWDVATGTPRDTLRGHEDLATVSTFSSDGRRLVSASRDGTVIIWNVRAAKPILSFRASTTAISSLALSPNGDRLATAGEGNQVKIWELRKLAKIEKQPTTSGREWDLSNAPDVVKIGVDGVGVRSVTWSPDGRYLVWVTSRGDREDKLAFVTVWDSTTRQKFAKLGKSGESAYRGMDISFSRDGKQLAIAHVGGTVTVWDFAAMLRTKE